jgi:hypothetical protein
MLERRMEDRHDQPLELPTSGDERDLGSLLDLQQGDGGWSYSTDLSWTEPTCYALMATRWSHGPERAIGLAGEWLARRQRPDGGWSPGSAVEQSTHVTSLGVLALSGLEGYEDIADRGVLWLLSQAGAESSFWARTARLLMGAQSSATRHTGWPWLPGAAAWVIPTSLAILALLKQREGRYGSDIEPRVRDARSFLLSRRCPDHGWNHGGIYREGERPNSYPETTGIALLALSGITASEIARSIGCAEQHARAPRSSEGDYWLRLGLSSHGRNPAPSTRTYRNWTVNQLALAILARNVRAGAGKAGSNAFIDHV